MKKIIAVLLTIAMAVSLLPSYLLATEAVDFTGLADLVKELDNATQLLYTGNSEQTRKYLADRIERAEAVLFDTAAGDSEIAEAKAELTAAVESLQPMNACETVQLFGFDQWTEEDFKYMKECTGTLAIDRENKPEGKEFSISVTADKGYAVLSNGSTRSTVAGCSPFGMDMTKADGLKLWVSPSQPAVLSVTVGHRGDGEYYSFVMDEIHVDTEGYLYLPFDRFVSNDQTAVLKKDGTMNYLIIASNGADTVKYADLNAYDEILENSTAVEYSEEKILSRNKIVDNAYYKIIDPSSGKALTLGPEVSETAEIWQDCTGIVESGRTFYLSDSVQGDRTQLWQLAPAPSGSGNFRIINKSSSAAMVLSESKATVNMAEVNLADTKQEWALSATAGNFTIQVRNAAKLTFAGDTVKATAGTSYKKFNILLVHDVEYVQTWSDEFDGDSLDRTKWDVMDGAYMGGANLNTFQDNEGDIDVSNGTATLKAKMERVGNGGFQLNGTYLTSGGKYAISYGKVEIRAKIPSGPAQHFALWLMPVDMMNMGGSEVDIMEIVTVEDQEGLKECIGTLHWTTDDGATHKSKVLYMKCPDYLCNDYHVYTAEMDKEQVRLYLDGTQYMSVNKSSEGREFAFGDMARYILINNTNRGDNYCLTIPGVEYPDEYDTEIDYVRCYQESGEVNYGTTDFTSEANINYSTNVNAAGGANYWDYTFPMDINDSYTEGAAAELYGGKVYIFNPLTNETLRVLDISPATRAIRTRYSPDGRWLAVATTQGIVAVFDTDDYSKAPKFIYNGATIQENLLFTKDSTEIIVGGYNGGSQQYKNAVNGLISNKWCFRVYDSSTAAMKKEINVGSDPRFISLSSDGSLAAVTTTSNGTFIYNVSDWTEYAHLEGTHEYAIRGADFSKDGKYLVTSDEGGTIALWNVENKSFVRKMNNVNTGSVRRVLFAPDGKNVLATGTYGAARLFDVQNGELVSLLGGFDNLIREIAYSPDGKYIVAASYDCTAKLFAADGTYLETLLPGDITSNGYISSSIRFSSDSSEVWFTTKTLPTMIHKWALPKEIDKHNLIELINSSTGEEPGYKYAVMVSKLKYASIYTVAAAYYGLTTKKMPVQHDLMIVIGKTMKPSNFNSAMLGENIYIFTKNDLLRKDLYISVTDLSDNSRTLIPIDESNLIYSLYSDFYNAETKIVRLKMDKAGEFSVGITDAEGESVFCSAPVSVDGTKTATNEFIYDIQNDQVKILACISGEPDIEIPDYIEGYPVTTIGKNAFFAYGIQIHHMTVKLPSTLKTIEEYAFRECQSIRELDLPEGLTKIAGNAFYSCNVLESLRLPDSIQTLSSGSLNQIRGLGTLTLSSGIKNYSGSHFSNVFRIREIIIEDGVQSISSGFFSSQYLLEKLYIPQSITSLPASLFYNCRNIVTVYGVAGSYAQTYAETYPDKYRFVAIGNPAVSGISDGQTIDLKDGAVPSATWDNGHIAYLNGEGYKAGTPITEPGEYTLRVINGYDEYATEIHFTVADTTPEPAVDGIKDGAEYDLYDGEPVSLTWTPAEATATLNGTAYTAGTEITEPGEYKLVVTNGTKTTEINFTVKDTSTVPVISGIEEGREYDLYAGEKPSATWDAGEATLNGEPYVAGTAIEAVGEYKLVVVNGTKSAEVNFKVVDNTPPYTPGDFDNDGQITVADALAALRIGAKLVEETPETIAIGDVDKDGHVTVADALAILRVAARLVDHF